MTFHFNPISDTEFLFNRIQMLSSLSVITLAKKFNVPESEVMQHPDFEEEAKKLIDRITF
jgi:hypothetical protein